MVLIPSTTRAVQFFQPVAGSLPSGIVTTNTYDATVGTYTNPTNILWNSGHYNKQGQQWEAIDAGDPGVGVRNAATPRTNASDNNKHFLHTTQFEFMFTGLQFEIQCNMLNAYDMQVWIEWGGRMWRVQSEPLAGTTPGIMYRRITFATRYHGRIRVHLGGGAFIGVVTEQSSIVKPAPDRLFGICDGDSWADSIGLKQASGTSYLCGDMCYFLFERTGMTWASHAQGGTGFFNNGSGAVTDDTPNGANSTRFFSSSRINWMIGGGPAGVSDFSNKPLFYLINGTWNDGSYSGATGSQIGPMATRAYVFYQWIRSQDPLCTIVQVSPEPLNLGGSAGASNGPPTAGNVHDLNRQEQMLSIAKISKAKYIDSFGPSTPWWAGSGSAGTPVSSQQAAIIGADGMHLTHYGYEFYVGMIVAELGQMRIPINRARRQA